jgi:hypothetical protein
MTLVWLDAATSTPGDTLPDVWFSYRHINSSVWSAPENLTLTPTFAEFVLHAAPYLKANGGGSYTLFLCRSYQTGLTTFPPDNTLLTTIYCGTHTFTPTAVGDDGAGLPTKFSLGQNYPNPFNPTTTIEYALPAGANVKLTVSDLLGREIATLVNEFQGAGSHSVQFSAANLPSGVYYYTVQAGTYVGTKKMLLLK